MGIRGGLVMKDFCVEQNINLENLALIGEMLGVAGVNIEGLCFTSFEELTVIHFAVEDAVTTRRVLKNLEIKIRDVSDVFALSKDQKRITGKPGSFGEICRTLANHGIRINFGYPAENNRFIFGVDDLARARELLE
jgi:hypothetical protein